MGSANFCFLSSSFNLVSLWAGTAEHVLNWGLKGERRRRQRVESTGRNLSPDILKSWNGRLKPPDPCPGSAFLPKNSIYKHLFTFPRSTASGKMPENFHHKHKMTSLLVLVNSLQSLNRLFIKILTEILRQTEVLIYVCYGRHRSNK